MIQVGIVVFDQFTEIDFFIPFDCFNRVCQFYPDLCDLKIISTKPQVTSMFGVDVKTPNHLDQLKTCDYVIFISSPQTRKLIYDQNFLDQIQLSPKVQMVGGICSGALIMAAIGLLKNQHATTYKAAENHFENFGVKFLEQDFVESGQYLTSANCLASPKLIGKIIKHAFGNQVWQHIESTISPRQEPE